LVAAAAVLLGVTPTVDLVEVGTLDHDVAERFVGSPTIRVNGHDVAAPPPTVDAHTPSLGCRIYDTDRGPSGVPDERLVSEAMASAAKLDS
jgi:hypothetical protein